jgi:hypothetical protein
MHGNSSLTLSPRSSKKREKMERILATHEPLPLNKKPNSLRSRRIGTIRRDSTASHGLAESTVL